MAYARLSTLVFIWIVLGSGASTQSGPAQCPCSLFGSTVPAIVDAGPDSAVELGARFTVRQDGYITAIRFYKSTANVGPHVGRLWSNDGVSLGSVTFTNESESGWQEARFAVPISVTAGTTYVASYRAPTGHYAFTADYFLTEAGSGPLAAVASSVAPNGLYTYAADKIPTASYRSANYWVDVSFDTMTAAVPTVIGVLPAAGATGVTAPVEATFNRDMDPTTVQFVVRRPDGTAFPGTVTYDAASHVARFTPSGPLAGLTTYAASVNARSATGDAMPAPFTWSFTTGAVGFRDSTVMSGLQAPTTFRFGPAGEIFVAEKSGIIKVFEGFNDSTPVIFADLRTQVHNFWDRGLLGMTLDPAFPQQPYVYVAYSRDAVVGGVAPLYGKPGETTDPCPSVQGPLGDGCIVSARVSRLRAVAVAGGYQMSGPEEVLVEGWGQQYPSHSIGGLEFGADGALYVTGGEGASYSFVDYGHRGTPPNPLGDTPTPAGIAPTPPTAEGGALRSQSLRRASGPVLLNGMVLRIDPASGNGLPDNPLASSTDANSRRVIAEGLRNPYRFTIRPGTNDVWIGDVGWNDIEEINLVPAPARQVLNFGWPCYEGVEPQPGYQATQLAICQGLYAAAGAVAPPAFQYAHYQKVVPGEACQTGSSSVSGLAFYTGGTYPSEYTGALFFADYSRRCVWAALADGSGQVDFSRTVSVLSDAAGPVELRAGPGGDLFYADLNYGKIHRIEYLSSAETQVVSAAIVATPASGPAPLVVQFDGTQSAGTSLTYTWDFGDGSAPATGAQVAHTYAIGTYTPRLTVTAASGAAAQATSAVSATSAPPVPVIDAPLSPVQFAVGDTIAFSGGATDPVDGALPASQLSWALVMNHCSDADHCHTHPIQDFAGVAAGSFRAPDHEYPCYMVLTLTARNSKGVSASSSVRLDPRTVTLTFGTLPAGLSLVLGSSSAVAPVSQTRIVGSSSSIAAPAEQTLNGTAYRFVGWSDGGTQTHDIFAPPQEAAYTATYAAQQATESTLLGMTVPATADAGADSPVELGVRFTADVAGNVTGVRFYKSAGNTGTHVGSLWTATGTRLASVTFTGESASGWQEARFAGPVAIVAGTTYVVSYHTTVGHYSYNSAFFASAFTAGVLRAPAASNGVYKYGPSGSFPASSYGASNYWADVLFTPAQDTTPPAVTSVSPSNGVTGVAASAVVTATFGESLIASSVTAGTLVMTDAAGNAVAGTVAYDSVASAIGFSPTGPLAPDTAYSVRVVGGSSPAAPRDAAGNALPSDVTWSFRTEAAVSTGCPCSLFPASTVPAILDGGADSPVELGVRFKAATSGSVLGVRFHKSLGNTGVHIGSLWSVDGSRLAQVTFAAESPSGWQEARFTSPIVISAGTTYVVSYHTTVGHYSLTPGFFAAAWDRAPLSAAAGANGVYRYGPAGQFPASMYNASNYWVDLVFAPDGPDVMAPVVNRVDPAAAASGVPLDAVVVATFNEAMLAGSITPASFSLRDGTGAPVGGTVSYDATSFSARFTPSSALQPSTTYTIVIAGSSGSPVRDVAGNALAADVTSTFGTAVPVADGCPCSLFTASSVPAVADAGADSSVELGVRFTASQDGFIRGVRFYKSPANTGPHDVSFWTGTGTLLAQATSTAESASGWQEVTFATPVAITAGTVYVASYHITGGHYSYSGSYFTAPRDAGPLQAPAGANGVYAYGAWSVYPGSSWNSTNYWVDVVFTRP